MDTVCGGSNRRRHAQMLRKIDIADPMRNARLGLRSTATNRLGLPARARRNREADFWFYAG